MLTVGFGVMTWAVVQLRRGVAVTSKRIDHILARLVEVESKAMGLQSWASSWVSFHENLAKRNDGEIDKLNKRLIELETENKNTPPQKSDDDDPYGGPRSWSAQAAAAERGLGVRSDA